MFKINIIMSRYPFFLSQASAKTISSFLPQTESSQFALCVLIALQVKSCNHPPQIESFNITHPNALITHQLP